MTTVTYRSGYKYQLAVNFKCVTDIFPDEDIRTPYINLLRNGVLIIQNGYASDGPSGPTIDTKNFMRAAFVHDALYQLMRQGHLPRTFRDDADRLLRKICIEDGMSKIRAAWVYYGLKYGGAAAASESSVKELHTAP